MVTTVCLFFLFHRNVLEALKVQVRTFYEIKFIRTYEKGNMSRKACDTHSARDKVCLLRYLQRESVLNTHFVLYVSKDNFMIL